MEMTVHKGRRWSAANAYLKDALKRPNLRLIKGALVERVLFEGTRATGVRFETGGSSQDVHAGKEVILAASSINSPKILLQSGIGPAEDLKALGLSVVADRPGVGQNLQDHLELYIQQACTQPITLFKHWNPISKAVIGLQWLLQGKGLGASNHFEACAFIRSKAGSNTRISSITSCLLPCAMTARQPPKAMASRPMSVRCAPGPAAGLP